MITLSPAFLTTPIAHRGLHDRSQGRIENAPQSFGAAIRHGYGIELDVQLSSDGQAMVFHDYTLDRLTHDKGPVAMRSRAELESIQLKDTTDAIPALADVLAQISGQMPVVIEIKDQDGAMGPNVGPLEQAVADCLSAYNGDAAVMSFNPHSMVAFVDMCDTRAIGLVTDRFDDSDWPTVPKARRAELRDIPDLAKCSGSFISHNQGQLDMDVVADLKSKGTHILCWTIRSETAETHARRIVYNVTFEDYLA